MMSLRIQSPTFPTRALVYSAPFTNPHDTHCEPTDIPSDILSANAAFSTI